MLICIACLLTQQSVTMTLQASWHACLAANSAQRRSSTRPSSRPSGVSRRSALSLRSSRRNSEREVSMR